MTDLRAEEIRELLDPVEHEAFATIDRALRRLAAVRLDPAEVNAWSVLRFMFQRDKRGDLLASVLNPKETTNEQ